MAAMVNHFQISLGSACAGLVWRAVRVPRLISVSGLMFDSVRELRLTTMRLCGGTSCSRW